VEATITTRIRTVLHDRIGDIPSLVSSIGYRAKGAPLFHIYGSLRRRSVLAAFYLDRFLAKDVHRLAAYNSWALQQFSCGASSGIDLNSKCPRATRTQRPILPTTRA